MVVIEVMVSWVVMLFRDEVGFDGPFCLHLHSGCCKSLWNISILPHHYTASQPWRP